MVHPTKLEFDTILNHMLGERIAGRPKQDPYTESLIQNYRIGSRMQTPDSLVWHYCHAGALGTPVAMEGRGMVSNVLPSAVHFYATIGACAAGAVQVVINDAGALGVRPADYYAGGVICILPATPAWTNQQIRKIKSSTPGNGVSITLTLYYPLTILCPNASGVDISQSKYALVNDCTTNPSQSFVPFVCVPLMRVTALHYFWGLTWGEYRPALSGDLGLVVGQRTAYFQRSDGSITEIGQPAYVPGNQVAGYYIADTLGVVTPTEDHTFPRVMLQLDP